MQNKSTAVGRFLRESETKLRPRVTDGRAVRQLLAESRKRPSHYIMYATELLVAAVRDCRDVWPRCRSGLTHPRFGRNSQKVILLRAHSSLA